MNDPGAKPITVRLMGEDLPLKITRRGLRRAEYEARVPLFGPDRHFWEQAASGMQPFQLVVLMYAALAHLNRFTFDQIDEAMELEQSVEYAEKLTACMSRDFPSPKEETPEGEPDASPFETPTSTG